MSHHPKQAYERAFDSAIAYHLHVAAGITTARGHQIAAGLADAVADAEYLRAAEADSAGERRMFCYAGDKARATRDFHLLAADITAIGEQAIDQ